MPSPLFAISELLIVVAALWCSLTLAKDKRWLAAMGVAILGAIAAIGVYRFGLNHIDALAAFHKSASQIGGGFAMMLIGSQFLLMLPIIKDNLIAKIALLVSISASLWIVVTIPAKGMLLVIIWMLAPILITAYLPKKHTGERLLLIGLASILLISFLAVRQSPTLGVVYSWHAYHALIAIWLIALNHVIKNCIKQAPINITK